MFPVLLCGNVSEKFFNRLRRSMEKAPTEYFLAQIGKTGKISGSSGILVLCGDPDELKGKKIPPGFLGIVSSTDSLALSFLKESGIRAVTCGASVRDTFSLSSLKEDCASISLQRDFIRPDGLILEEQEFFVRLSKDIDAQSLLLIAAVLIISSHPHQNIEI